MTAVWLGRADTGGPSTVVGFAASAGGLGRTAAISNVAWILAAAGQRVLIVDWSGDQIRTQDYLGPFQIGAHRFSDLDDDEDGYEPPVARLDDGVDIDDVEVTRYAVPVGSRQVDVISLPPSSACRWNCPTTRTTRTTRHSPPWWTNLATPTPCWPATSGWAPRSPGAGSPGSPRFRPRRGIATGIGPTARRPTPRRGSPLSMPVSTGRGRNGSSCAWHRPVSTSTGCWRTNRGPSARSGRAS